MDTCSYDDDRHRVFIETHICPMSSKTIDLCGKCNTCACACVCYEWICKDCKNEYLECFLCQEDDHNEHEDDANNEDPVADVSYTFTREGLKLHFLFQFNEHLLAFETPKPIELKSNGCSKLKLTLVHKDPLSLQRQDQVLFNGPHSDSD